MLQKRVKPKECKRTSTNEVYQQKMQCYGVKYQGDDIEDSYIDIEPLLDKYYQNKQTRRILQDDDQAKASADDDPV